MYLLVNLLYLRYMYVSPHHSISLRVPHHQITLPYCSPQAVENVGMVMVFTLVSAAQDKLVELMDAMKDLQEQEKKREEEEKKRQEEVCVRVGGHA